MGSTPLVVVRLSADQLAALEKQLVPPAVTNQSTPLMAGYQLGIQEVLKRLRSGFAISE